LWAWVWRFKELEIGRRFFSDLTVPAVLGRPFFGFTLYLDLPRSTTHWLLYLQGERAIDERRIVRTLVKPGNRVIDVGANVGYYLLMIKSIVGDAGVVCFEPEPANLVELRRNVARNFLVNVHIVNAAVGADSRRVGFTRGINGRIAMEDQADITVETVALDSVVRESVDFVKIDVEGYEAQVLLGAERVITQYQPTLFVEVHPRLLTDGYSVADIVGFLRSHYNKVLFYECRRREDLMGKVLTRYGLIKQVVPVADVPRLLEACAGDKRDEPFWVACGC
jgi:FkbM family methyltransferase